LRIFDHRLSRERINPTVDIAEGIHVCGKISAFFLIILGPSRLREPFTASKASKFLSFDFGDVCGITRVVRGVDRLLDFVVWSFWSELELDLRQLPQSFDHGARSHMRVMILRLFFVHGS
jgi:hypothetical protein